MKIHLILALFVAISFSSCTFVPNNGGGPVVGGPPVVLHPPQFGGQQFGGPQFGGPQFGVPPPNYGGRMGSQVNGFTPFRMNYPQWQQGQGGPFNNSPRW